MAKTMQKSAPSTKEATTNADAKVDKVVNDSSILSIDNVMAPPKRKKYKDDQEIPCRSVTAGLLTMRGEKSDRVYTWQGMNDVQYVEYRDLIFSYRQKSPLIFKPRFVILDGEFVDQYSDIAECYKSLYSFSEIKKILDLKPSELRKAVENLPDGIKDSIKITVSTMIDEGTFDSAQRIKVLDDIFGTDMLIKLTQ